MKTRSQTLGVVSDTDMSQEVEPLVSSIGHGPRESRQESSPNDSVDSKTFRFEIESYNEKGANGDSLQEVISDQESDDTSQGSDDKSQDSEDSEPKDEHSDSKSENRDYKIDSKFQIIHLILKSYMQAMMIGKTQLIQKSKTTVHCTRRRSAPP
jgi:hypothetical protein